MQQGGPQVHRSGADCHQPNTEGQLESGFRQEEVLAVGSQGQEDTGHQAAAHQGAGEKTSRAPVQTRAL